MLAGKRGLIVWLHHMKQIRALKKYGNLHYVSNRMRYAVLYCDTDRYEAIVQLLKKQRFTKSVEPSHLHELKMHYAKAKDPQKAREEEMIF
ncbi:YlbG family protein [Camelliibacillus cellulosilyticus]|uniref:YlbG family protein n=1 Tax=Camelliibacillus cellulosilyticus TaxID=2174486 RepID=A0ABV9GG25_9BACL